jgi:hypothetical protein
MISSGVGHRWAEAFEKIVRPFTDTSNTPRSPRTSSASMPRRSAIAAARLAA